MTAGAKPLVVKDRLGPWSLYFAAKLVLFVNHHIGFDLAWNLLFFFAILATAPGPANVSKAKRWARNACLTLAAFAVLWRDSWLPSIGGELAFLRQNAPTTGFVLTFLTRTLLTLEIVALGAVLAFVYWAGKRVHLTWVVLASFFVAGILRTADANLTGLDGRLQAFYYSEGKRIVRFPRKLPDGQPFDVVVLQICSLGTEDLRVAGLADDPFWGHFDILLTRFNTVTAHSSPANLRLLRAPCGQVRHDDLYRVPSQECGLFDRLRGLGYRTYVENDNPVVLGGYGQPLHEYGLLPLNEPIPDLPKTLVNFDGSPIFDEGEMLTRWWKARLGSSEPRAALYSNIQVLHGGAHAPNEAGWWRRSREESYRGRFASLKEAIARFEADVFASDRRVLLIVVPEHGAALRGSSMLPPDLRELPLPYLTVAPVGVKFLGWAPLAEAPQIKSDKRLTYFALASFLTAVLRDPSVGADRTALERVVADLPETPFVAENQGAVVVNQNDGYYLHTTARGWHVIPTDALPGAWRRP